MLYTHSLQVVSSNFVFTYKETSRLRLILPDFHQPKQDFNPNKTQTSLKTAVSPCTKSMKAPELGNLPPDGLAVIGVGDAQPQQGDLAQPDEGPT